MENWPNTIALDGKFRKIAFILQKNCNGEADTKDRIPTEADVPVFTQRRIFIITLCRKTPSARLTCHIP